MRDEKPFDSLVMLGDDSYKVLIGNIGGEYDSLFDEEYTFIKPARPYDYTDSDEGQLKVKFQDKYDPSFLHNEVRMLPNQPNLKADVYGLEVADFGTYFVGEQGLWVADGSKI